MTEALIPFLNNQESGYEELGGASPQAFNVVVDPKGVVRRRPGITRYAGARDFSNPNLATLPGGFAGLYVTRAGTLFAVAGTGPERPIYLVTSSGETALGGGLSPYGLRGSLRPIFAETELLLVVAGGAEIQKVELNTNTSSRLGGNPPKASHVLANANRLLANDMTIDRSAVRFSGIFGGDTSFAQAENWAYGGFGTSGYFTAQTRPDDVVALAQVANEVFVIGQTTIQPFQPDPISAYAPLSTTEQGTSAPYSVVVAESNVFMLDQLRRFTQGGNVISGQIKKTLDSITTISDCFGFRVLTGPVDCMVWSFPTDGRTFALQAGGGWSQWAGWSTSTNNWQPFRVTGHSMRQDRSENVVCTNDGKIGKLDPDVFTDFGEPIRAFVSTGYLNRNTSALKHCNRVRFQLKRGVSSGSSAQKARFGWRDRPGPWETSIEIDLGVTGDTDPVVQFPSLGTYQMREWFFEFSGTDELCLVSAIEDFTVLEV